MGRATIPIRPRPHKEGEWMSEKWTTQKLEQPPAVSLPFAISPPSNRRINTVACGGHLSCVYQNATVSPQVRPTRAHHLV